MSITSKLMSLNKTIINIQFGSWSYSEELLDLQHLEPKGGVEFREELNQNTNRMENVSLVVEGIGVLRVARVVLNSIKL
jgi:hypothetical protein